MKVRSPHRRQSSTKHSKPTAIGTLALPDHFHAPPFLAQLSLHLRIPAHIRCELFQPERAIPRRRRRAPAAGVTMPEAAVNEHGPLPAAVGDVGRAGKIAVLNAVPVSLRMKKVPHRELSAGAVLTDPAQALRGFAVEDQRWLGWLRGTAVSRAGHDSDDRTQRFVVHASQVNLEGTDEIRRESQLCLSSAG